MKNKETAVVEMVEEEVTVFDGRTAVRTLKLILAELDRLETPGRRSGAKQGDPCVTPPQTQTT